MRGWPAVRCSACRSSALRIAGSIVCLECFHREPRKLPDIRPRGQIVAGRFMEPSEVKRRERAVLACVTKAPGVSTLDASKRVSLPVDTTRSILKRLMAGGQLHSKNVGRKALRWYPTEAP